MSKRNVSRASRNRARSDKGGGIASARRVVPPVSFRTTVLRFGIGVLALAGAGVTAYLSYVGFSGADVACFSSANDGGGSCQGVLNTSWATFGGAPLALYGLIAYIFVGLAAVAPIASGRTEWHKPTAFFLLFASTSMGVFSIYLMVGHFFLLDVDGVCYYCITSAVITLALAGLSAEVFRGYPWNQFKPAFYAAGAGLIFTLIIALPVFTNSQPDVVDGRIVTAEPFGDPTPPLGWPLSTTSGVSEISLAEHLTAQGATMYGAWWCPHCYSQKQLFGEEASKLIPYVECAPRGVDPQTAECTGQDVRSYPTWVVGGETFVGVQSLENLAFLSEYSGPTDFTYISSALIAN